MELMEINEPNGISSNELSGFSQIMDNSAAIMSRQTESGPMTEKLGFDLNLILFGAKFKCSAAAFFCGSSLFLFRGNESKSA